MQVGANDGEMSDPINRFIRLRKDIRFYRVEPIKFYFDKLRRYHSNDFNVICSQCAIGDVRIPTIRSIYFIDPNVASDMNGESTYSKNWAHGQGSFDSEIIEYYINENRFRGKSYSASIERFKNSIESCPTVCISLESYLDFNGISRVYLLVVDVQGFELEVIKSIGRHRPEYILYENDTGKDDCVKPVLSTLGYEEVYTSGSNKIVRYLPSF